MFLKRRGDDSMIEVNPSRIDSFTPMCDPQNNCDWKMRPEARERTRLLSRRWCIINFKDGETLAVNHNYTDIIGKIGKV